MPQTHYPKTENNLICSWVWPRLPEKPPFKSLAPFVNLADKALAPGEEFVAHHSALGCTRLYTTMVADQALEVTFECSNDEVDRDGNWITDETLPLCNWDHHESKVAKVGDRKGHWILILGRWLRVTVKNVGSAPVKEMRVHVRGSVF